MQLLMDSANLMMLVGWTGAQLTTAVILFMGLKWVLKKYSIPEAISAYFNKGLEERIAKAVDESVNKAVNTQIGDLKAYVTAVHELAKKTGEMQDKLVETITAMSAGFESLYNVCPFGRGNGRKYPDSQQTP